MNFWKSAKGGVVIFNPTNYIADFGLFDHEIDTK